MSAHVFSIFAQLTVVSSLYAFDNARTGNGVHPSALAANKNNLKIYSASFGLLNEYMGGTYLEANRKEKDIKKRYIVEQQPLSDAYFKPVAYRGQDKVKKTSELDNGFKKDISKDYAFDRRPRYPASKAPAANDRYKSDFNDYATKAAKNQKDRNLTMISGRRHFRDVNANLEVPDLDETRLNIAYPPPGLGFNPGAAVSAMEVERRFRDANAGPPPEYGRNRGMGAGGRMPENYVDRSKTPREMRAEDMGPSYRPGRGNGPGGGDMGPSFETARRRPIGHIGPSYNRGKGRIEDTDPSYGRERGTGPRGDMGPSFGHGGGIRPGDVGEPGVGFLTWPPGGFEPERDMEVPGGDMEVPGGMEVPEGGMAEYGPEGVGPPGVYRANDRIGQGREIKLRPENGMGGNGMEIEDSRPQSFGSGGIRGTDGVGPRPDGIGQRDGICDQAPVNMVSPGGVETCGGNRGPEPGLGGTGVGMRPENRPQMNEMGPPGGMESPGDIVVGSHPSHTQRGAMGPPGDVTKTPETWGGSEGVKSLGGARPPAEGMEPSARAVEPGPAIAVLWPPRGPPSSKVVLQTTKASITTTTNTTHSTPPNGTYQHSARKHFPHSKKSYHKEVIHLKYNHPKIYDKYIKHHKKHGYPHERSHMHKYDKLIDDYLKDVNSDDDHSHKKHKKKKNKHKKRHGHSKGQKHHEKFRLNVNRLLPTNGKNRRMMPIDHGNDTEIGNNTSASQVSASESNEYTSEDNKRRQFHYISGEHTTVPGAVNDFAEQIYENHMIEPKVDTTLEDVTKKSNTVWPYKNEERYTDNKMNTSVENDKDKSNSVDNDKQKNMDDFKENQQQDKKVAHDKIEPIFEIHNGNESQKNKTKLKPDVLKKTVKEFIDRLKHQIESLKLRVEEAQKKEKLANNRKSYVSPNDLLRRNTKNRQQPTTTVSIGPLNTLQNGFLKLIKHAINVIGHGVSPGESSIPLDLETSTPLHPTEQTYEPNFEWQPPPNTPSRKRTLLPTLEPNHLRQQTPTEKPSENKNKSESVLRIKTQSINNRNKINVELDLSDGPVGFYPKLRDETDKLRKELKFDNSESDVSSFRDNSDPFEQRGNENISPRVNLRAKSEEFQDTAHKSSESVLKPFSSDDSEHIDNEGEPTNLSVQDKMDKTSNETVGDGTNNPSLRKILEDTSYSDEELTLKLNLQNAMFHPHERRSLSGVGPSQETHNISDIRKIFDYMEKEDNGLER